MTSAQFAAALRDLLGEFPVPALEPDIWLEGFTTVGAAATAVSSRTLTLNAEAIDAGIRYAFDATRRMALVGCVPAADLVCARNFVTRFGRRAWRRPLGPREIDRFVAVAAELGKGAGGPQAGLEAAASALLQSPDFQYQVTLGEPDATAPGGLRYTSLEMATRLSFALWNRSPDEDLLEAGESGSLKDPVALRAQAMRLFASPRAREGLTAFVRELYGLGNVQGLVKDAKLFPQLTPALRKSMEREVVLLFQDIAFDKDGDLLALLDADYAFVDKDLVKLYGLRGGPTGDTPARVALPATGRRAGVLTTSALLALTAKQNETSPTGRGRFVREEILCQHVPEPPDVDMALPATGPAGKVLSRREQVDLHKASPNCRGCHELMDPIGLAFENFDALGVERQTERGIAIDPRGSLEDVDFADARGLATALRRHPAAVACLVKQLFRYLSAAPEQPGEVPLLRDLLARFDGQGRRLSSLALDLVTSDGFRFAAIPATTNGDTGK